MLLYAFSWSNDALYRGGGYIPGGKLSNTQYKQIYGQFVLAFEGIYIITPRGTRQNKDEYL